MKDKGFTIIELLVVMGIFATIAGIATSIFVTILRAQNKAMVVNQVKDEGDRVMEAMLREIRSAQSASCVVDADSNGVCEADGSGNTELEITTFSATTTRLGCNTNTTPDNSYIYKDDPAVSLINKDSKKGVDIFSCANIFSILTPSGTDVKIVKIYFYLAQGKGAPTRQDYNIAIPFVSSVNLRSY